MKVGTKLQPAWESRRLGDCGRWVSGGTPRKSDPRFWNGDIPWFSAKSLKTFDLDSSEDRVTREGATNGTTLVPSGTVLFVVRGMSLANEFRVGITSRESTLNQDLRGILTDDDICSRFLGRFLKHTTAVMGEIDNASHGTKRIQTDKLKDVLIPLPPLTEQKRIADILDKADAIRRKRQEAVELVQSKLLKSTFREHLGDPRTNPRGWPVVQLGEAINFVGGSQPPKTTFINERRPGYVRLVQIRDFKTDRYPTYIPKELAKRPFEKDDVMIARYGPPVFQILRGLEGTYNVALMKAENTERTTKDFIFYLLQLPEIHDVVVANSQRTAGQSGTNLTLLKSLEIPIPPIEKQNAITKILKTIETYQTKAESYSKAADDLFNVLVQRAFKGAL